MRLNGRLLKRSRCPFLCVSSMEPLTIKTLRGTSDFLGQGKSREPRQANHHFWPLWSGSITVPGWHTRSDTDNLGFHLGSTLKSSLETTSLAVSGENSRFRVLYVGAPCTNRSSPSWNVHICPQFNASHDHLHVSQRPPEICEPKGATSGRRREDRGQTNERSNQKCFWNTEFHHHHHHHHK